MTPTLFYCADGNRRFVEIALSQGYLYGAQLPNTVYFPPAFTDQDWRGFNRAKNAEERARLRRAYMETVERYRPRLATVLDWEHEAQLDEVLSWAEEVSQWVTEAVIIIPKVIGGIARLPRTVEGKEVRLGYSAATTFAGTPVSPSEFVGWPVHCLGGSPMTQMRWARVLDMRSADGNFIQNLARQFAAFYSPAKQGKRRGWPTLREAGIIVEHDAPYLAFTLTCIGVPLAWQGYSGTQIWEAQLGYLQSIGKAPLWSERGQLFEVMP